MEVVLMVLKLLRNGLGNLIAFISFIFAPNKISRSEEQQLKVDKICQDLSLYQFYGCPFCIKVRRTITKLNLKITYCDAKTEPFRNELLTKGGEIKVPCLKITTDGETKWLYESNDIIAYLNDKFA